MVIVNYAKNRITLLIGGSTTTTPTYFVIGSGSGTALVTQTTLIAETDRQLNTSISYVTRKVSWQGDWNSVEMSGTKLTEVGVSTSGASLTGSIWSRTNFPSVTFDGTNELRIRSNWEIK